MRIVNVCLTFVPAMHDLVVTNNCFPHKTTHKCTWFHNGDRTRPGRMIDYVLVNHHFRTSILDTHVFRSTYVESFLPSVKIKAKCLQNIGLMKWQASGLSQDMRLGFKVALAAALPTKPTEEDAEKVWGALKSAFSEAQDTLPNLPQRREREWVTE